MNLKDYTTAGELIKKLSKFPSDAIVRISSFDHEYQEAIWTNVGLVHRDKHFTYTYPNGRETSLFPTKQTDKHLKDCIERTYPIVVLE